MPVNLPTPLEAWRALSPAARRVGSMVAIGLATIAALAWLATKFGTPLQELVRHGVDVDPFEWAQLQEDKRHGGEIPHSLTVKEGITVLHYDGADCLLVRRSGEERLWSAGKAHRASASDIPPLAGVEAAGLAFAGGSTCLTANSHPGLWTWATEGLSGAWEQPTADPCWRWRLGPFIDQRGEPVDGCELAVPWDACWLRYAWEQAQWTRCDWH